MYMPRVLIYTAGVCDPDPGGPGGYGIILKNYETLYCKLLSGGRSNTTGDRMAIIAATHALKALKTPCWVTFFSTSEYFISALRQGHIESWQRQGWFLNPLERPKNLPLWQKFVGHFCGHRELNYHLADDPDCYPSEIKRCEHLALAASKETNLPPDEGYNESQANALDDLTGQNPLCPHCHNKRLTPKKASGTIAHDLDMMLDFYDYYYVCSNCGIPCLVEEEKKQSFPWFLGPP